MPQQDPLVVAQTYLMQGRHKAALKTARAAMSKQGKDPAFANVIGVAMCGLGQQREAVAMFQKALRLNPDFADARRNLAQTLIVLNLPDKALAALGRLLAAAPADPGALYLQAQALANLGRSEEAVTAASAAIAAGPPQPRNHNLRGVLYNTLGLSAEALEDFETALRLDPNNVETLINVSLPLARQTRFDEALAAARRAVALAPQNAEAIQQLAALQDRDENAALEPVARAALKRAGARSPDRASLNFALARIADQAGDDDIAAGHLAEANRDMAALMPYDADRDSALNAAIMDYFPAPPSDTDTAAADRADGPVPIYVLGLPRSGTTLAEAILGAHPQVKPLGEQIAAGRVLYPMIETGQPFDADRIAAFRDMERRMLPPLPEGIAAWTDKMPENYRLIGFLKAAHPNARIVHIRRDPRDVALSMWRGQFSGAALNYTYDLAAMAHRFNLYAGIMAFWHRLLPGQILDLAYEEITADVEAASRTLAAHCGLDWVPAMARPDQTDAPVLTLSAGQLRQPVHRQSVGKWRQHAESLAPFIAGLDPVLWPGLEE